MSPHGQKEVQDLQMLWRKVLSPDYHEGLMRCADAALLKPAQYARLNSRA